MHFKKENLNFDFFERKRLEEVDYIPDDEKIYIKINVNTFS